MVFLYNHTTKVRTTTINKTDGDKTCHGTKIGVENVSVMVKLIESGQEDIDLSFPNGGAEVLYDAIGDVVIWPFAKIKQANMTTRSTKIHVDCKLLDDLPIDKADEDIDYSN